MATKKQTSTTKADAAPAPPPLPPKPVLSIQARWDGHGHAWWMLVRGEKYREPELGEAIAHAVRRATQGRELPDEINIVFVEQFT